MKIAIVGAGIGGLTAAALLEEQGHQVKVFEKNTSINELSAGIGIGDNVLKKLGHHDLAKDIKNAGQNLTAMNIYDEQGTPLMSAKLKSHSLNVALSRQTLIEIIQSYVEESSIHTGFKVTKIEQTSCKVTLHFTKQESESFDLCIGADGLHSVVRESVGARTKIRYNGYTCFRGMVEDVQFNDQHVANEYWGVKGRVGIVPLINQRAYWFITVHAKEGDPKYQSFGKPHLQAYFNHFPNEVRNVLERQSETGILLHDIYDLKPLKTFVYGRTILMGDAAHATTPNMGQGASQAMEDAIVLVNCLEKYDFNKAIERYDKLRVKHTTKVIRRSKKIGKMAQKHHKLTVKLRNTAMKLIPNALASAQTKFLYKSKEK